MLGFSQKECENTCRNLERDHPELLSENRREAREDLLSCLETDTGCRKVFADERRWENVASFAAELPSVMMLMDYRPRCISVTHLKTMCSNIKGNRETPGGESVKYFEYLKPRVDVKHRRSRTCAMVGNSPHIFRDGLIDENAKSIDKHDDVWRFNLRSGLANEQTCTRNMG